MALVEYVTGPRTLLRDVSELQNAATHRITWADTPPRLRSQGYWSLRYGPAERRNVQEWRNGLAERLEAIFRRYGTAIRSRGLTAHIPLSGGQDSRLELGILHKYGVDLQAFSYGPPGNEESATASRMASAAGDPIPLRLR